MKIVTPPRPLIQQTWGPMSLIDAMQIVHVEQTRPHYWASWLLGPAESVMLTVSYTDTEEVPLGV